MKPTALLAAACLLLLSAPSVALAQTPGAPITPSAPKTAAPAPNIPSAGRAPRGVSQPAWQQSRYPQFSYPTSKLASAQGVVTKLANAGSPIIAAGKGSWATVLDTEEIQRSPMSGSHYVATPLPTQSVNGVPATQLPANGAWVVVNRKTGAVSTGTTAQSAVQAATGAGTIIIDPKTGAVTRLGNGGGQFTPLARPAAPAAPASAPAQR